MTPTDPFHHDALERLMFGTPPFDPNPPKGGGGGNGDSKPQSDAKRAQEIKKLQQAQARNAKQGKGPTARTESKQGGKAADGDPSDNTDAGGERVDLTEIERKIIRERDARRRGY